MPRPSVREELLSAGLETLHRRGFNATSVQDITDAAGAPKGSFYNHFESKEALAAEAVRRYREKGRVRLSILQDEKLPPLRRLRKYFESLNQAVVEAGFSAGCLLGNFGAELSTQSALVREQVRKAFAGFVVHAWEGAMVRAKVEKGREPLDLFLKVTFSKILA